MAIILTQAQAFDLRSWSWYNGDRKNIIEPRLLLDGNYAVPESLLREPSLYPKRDVLLAGTIAAKVGGDFVADPSTGIIINGNAYELSIPHTPWAFSVIAADVHRFELRQGDRGRDDEDNPHRLHRNEIISQEVPPFGTNLWQSYSVMLEAGNSFTTNGQCYANQWHGYDSDVGYGRSPPLNFDYGNNTFRVVSRSDANIDPVTLSGVDVVHYSAASPARGSYNDIVVNVTFGSLGLLNVWLNGSPIVAYVGPIGYYNDAHGSYQQHGIYARQAPNVPVFRYANMEWSTSDLSDRILNPLPIAS